MGLRGTDRLRYGKLAARAAAVFIAALPVSRMALSAEPYRDRQIELPTGLRTGKPATALPAPAEWCLLNVRQEGTACVATDKPLTGAAAGDVLSKAAERKACIILRCDRRLPWRQVDPLLRKLAQARVPSFWFCAEAEKGNEVFIDCTIPKQHPDDELRREFWVRIKSAPGANNVEPRIMVQDRMFDSWDMAKQSLERYSKIPKAVEDEITLGPDEDARLDWVLKALDLLRQLKFERILFDGIRLPAEPARDATRKGQPTGDRE